VFVFNGTYNEQAYLEKSIRLIGESKDSTIIDAGGTGDASVVVCHAYYTTVSGFTIRHSGDYCNNAGVWIYDAWDHHSAYNTITDNIICDNHAMAISLYQSTHNIITNNTIFDNGGDVDFGSASNYNTFSGNILRNDSLTLWFSDSNTIANNQFQAGIISISPGSNNIVCNNHLFNSRGISISGNYGANSIGDNDLDGRPICYYIHRFNETVPSNASQVVLVSCNDIVIDHCTFLASYGVFLFESSGCTISNSTFIGCDPSISIANARYDRVIGNSISKSRSAIVFVNCQLNEISSNTITDNTYDITLEDCQVNRITFNTIANSSKGLYLDSSFSNHIQSNNFINNKYHAAFLADGPLRSHNYWKHNYWDNNIPLLPKIILGAIDTHLKIRGQYGYYFYIYLPWMNIDHFPAIRPNSIIHPDGT
jgi:parallel beta-helix repeat protein